MNVKCNGCGHIGSISEFRTDRDFFQIQFVAGCPKCDNRQSPGEASMRMFGGERPFVFVRDPVTTKDHPVVQIEHNRSEAS